MISQNTRQLLNTLVSLSSTSVRNYGRRIVTPKAVTNANVSRSGRRYPTREQKIANQKYVFDDVEPDVQDAFDSFVNPRPNWERLPKMYSIYKDEKLDEKYQGRKWRTINKHFKEYFKPDICLLTYAEKEQLRYLHETDPGEWSEENLAASFPISVESVRKLLKSPFRCLTVDEIKRHDAGVAEQLEKIRAGEIELSPELAQKMEIRNSIPIDFGAISTPELGLLVMEKPKKLGPFARLVTPNAPPEEQDRDDVIHSKQYSSKQKNSTHNNKGSKSVPLKPERWDVSESQKLEPSFEESKFLSGMAKGRMTLKTFEAEIQKAHECGEMSSLPENEQKKFSYLLNIQNSTPRPAAPILPSDDENSASFTGRTRIQKFASVSSDKVEVNVEKGEAYIYNSETGLQRPFSQRKQRVRFPRNAQKEGSVYKVGDSYYDENGEFLYRPI